MQKITQFDIQKAITHSRFFQKVKLTPSEKIVLRSLLDFYNYKEGLCYPSQELLAEVSDLSIRATKEAIKGLRNKYLILTTKKGYCYQYKLTNLFFEMINIAPAECRKEQKPSAEFAPYNKEPNKEIKKPFIKNSFSDGINYNSAREIINQYEKDKLLDAPLPKDFMKLVKSYKIASQNRQEAS